MTGALPLRKAGAPTPEARLEALDWDAIAAGLDAHGCAVIEATLSPDECRSLAAQYEKDGSFRSRVVMARHGFGRGEYKYYAHPLPDLVARLRAALYPRLAGIANRWNEAMGIELRYPDEHAEFLERCHRVAAN